MERADKCSIASSPAAARLPCQRSSCLPFDPLASRRICTDGRAQRSCPYRGGRNVVQKIPNAASHPVRSRQAGSVGCTVVPLLRKADGGKWQGPSRFGIPLSGWRGKDRGVPAKMGMQGVRGPDQPSSEPSLKVGFLGDYELLLAALGALLLLGLASPLS